MPRPVKGVLRVVYMPVPLWPNCNGEVNRRVVRQADSV